MEQIPLPTSSEFDDDLQDDMMAFDDAKLDEIPPLSLPEAAWLAGITPEAFSAFLEISNADVEKTDEDERSIRLLDLIQAAFTVLGQRESQMVMLRMQLAKALSREKDLVEILKKRIQLDDPLSLTTPEEAEARAKQEESLAQRQEALAEKEKSLESQSNRVKTQEETLAREMATLKQQQESLKTREKSLIEREAELRTAALQTPTPTKGKGKGGKGKKGKKGKRRK
ncbi:MAG: hypothetical protein HQL50_13410 [Magnetococcales bacterium]|nr:hypothetical protein [Magnetococcales bacterium]